VKHSPTPYLRPETARALLATSREQTSALRAARPLAIELQLKRAADKAAPRRFTGEPLSGFGALA
jgi:hypothetical protein